METLKVPKCILRFEQGNTRAWRVCVKREGAVFNKFFSDGVYGSPERALQKAIEYLNELRKAFPRSRKQSSSIVRRKSSGPIPGVRRVITTRKGHAYANWVASWSPEPGVRKNKRFGVLKYGEEEAKRLAISHRESELAKIKDTIPEEYESEFRELPVELINSGALAFPSSIKHTSRAPAAIKSDAMPDIFAYEGEKNYVLHQGIERSITLRRRKVTVFSKKHGRIFCELCHTNLKEAYPFLEKDFIEVHHIVPLSEVKSPACRSLDDLMLLCPNCHTAIHQGDAQDNLLKAMLIYKRTFE